MTLLDDQRSAHSAFCDVVLKCGDLTEMAHSAVLAAVSGFFEKILRSLVASGNNNADAANAGKKLIRLDVDLLFAGTEHVFSDLLTFLYRGTISESLTAEILEGFSQKLELKVKP